MRKTSRRIIPLLALVFLLANADTRVQTATEASEVGRGEDASGGVLVHFDYIEDGQLKGGVVTVPLPMTSLKTGLRIQSRWPATTLVDNGPSDNRIDLVFVGDGYTASELGDYASHVANIIAGFFDEEPFASYASYFNVHRVDVVSRESGVDEPDNGIYRDTALDMEYGCYSNPYLLCIDTDKAWAAASSAADADLVIALANSDRHGGAGYPDLATAGGGNYWAAGLTLHEFGHSQADLADEYYYDGTTYTGSEPSQKNVSVYTAAEQAALQTKWHRWLDHPGVDTYEGAYYHEYDIYRPTSTSKMRSIDQPFGPVNGERLIISFYDSISPIEDATASFPPLLPSDTLFHVTVTQPTSHSLDIQWAIDDVPVPGATDSTFRAPSLSAGIHDVSVTVTDNTDQVRDTSARETRLTAMRQWQIEVSAPAQHALTTSSTGGGIVSSPGEGVFQYDYGTSAPVTATAQPNYHFVTWTGTAVDADKVADAGSAGTTVTMDADYTLQANFAIDQKTLTTSSTAGGSVTTPGEGAYPYDHGSSVAITATAQPNYHFVNWTGTAVDAGKVADAGSASTTVTMDADYTLQANFAIDEKTLTISSTAGGSVTTPGEGAFPYDHGTSAAVTAAPDDNYHFVAWTGTAVDAGKVGDASAASTTVTMDADYTLQANFALDQKTLTISSTAGGSVTTPGEGAYPYDHGSSAAVQATAQPNYHFVTWTGTAADAGKVGDAGSASTTVTMDVDYTLQANFAIDQKTLAISSTAGGSVTMPGEGAFPYDHGTSAAVTAAPDDNYHFVAWTGTAVDAGKVGDAGSASTAVTVDADYTLEALFAIDQRALSLSSSVGGNVSMPGEGSFLYDHGTVVSVEAVAGANHMFLQWSGTAVEAGQISDPYSATTTIAMDSDCTLRANFTTALARVYVDDDSPEDPRPYDPSLSDPHEDGSAEHPFDEIQEAISVCRDGMYVIILEGVYHECIDSTGLNIVVTSTDPDDPSVVENTIIDGNGSGPVVRLASGEDPNCVLTGLTLTGGNNQRGGGIYCENSSPTIVKCVLTGNQAHYGGGLYTFQSSPTVTNCVFAGNLAAFRGGAVYDRESATVLMNCTLTGNIALDGGGICSTGSDLQLVNCIAWGNLANTGTDETAQVKVDGGALSVEYCCIAGWTGVLGGAGNFDADPCFADAGYWDDHSTPDDADDDSWVNGDYHLKSEAGRWDPNSGSWALDTVTSLCIDAGDPNSDWTAELWPHGKRVNMGAYGGTTQASMSLSNVGNISDYNNDGRVDGNDLRIFARRWLYGAECLAEDSNRDGIVDFFDYTDLAHSWQWKE